MKLRLCGYRKSARHLAGKDALIKPVHYVTEYANCSLVTGTGVTVTLLYARQIAGAFIWCQLLCSLILGLETI
jgi:hypothetical protein